VKVEKTIISQKLAGTGFIKNQKNQLKTSQNLIFENIESEPVSTDRFF
jgi:hypothetical protein